VIEPALARGADVVCDRYSASTLAYQGYGRGLAVGELQDLNDWATGCLAPDLVILLDLPLEVARRRLRSAPLDRIEAGGDEFLERAQAGFRQLAAADPARWRVVDAGGSVDEVAARVWAVAEETRLDEQTRVVKPDRAGQPAPDHLIKGTI
jgi:dTMP kinase